MGVSSAPSSLPMTPMAEPTAEAMEARPPRANARTAAEEPTATRMPPTAPTTATTFTAVITRPLLFWISSRSILPKRVSALAALPTGSASASPITESTTSAACLSWAKLCASVLVILP